MNGGFDGIKIMIRQVYVVLVVIEKCIFDVNESGLSGGDIVVWIGADDEEVSYEALGLTLCQKGGFGLMNLGRIEGLFEELDYVLDLHHYITVNILVFGDRLIDYNGNLNLFSIAFFTQFICIILSSFG